MDQTYQNTLWTYSLLDLRHHISIDNFPHLLFLLTLLLFIEIHNHDRLKHKPINHGAKATTSTTLDSKNANLLKYGSKKRN